MEAAIRSPCLMNGKVQVIRAILTCVTRVGLESQRLNNMRDEILTQMIDDFATETANANTKRQG